MKFFTLAMLIWGFAANADLILFSDRPAEDFEMAAAEFKARTGETLQLVTFESYENLKSALLDKHGTISRPDMVVVKDIAYIGDLQKNSLLKPFISIELKGALRPQLMDPNGEWLALSLRPRTIIYNTAEVDPNELSTYEDLASPKWEGRLCLRTGKASYNQSLVAWMIFSFGLESAHNILKGWMNNLAMDPLKNDTMVIESVATNLCQVGIVNSYYLAGQLKQKPQLPVRIFFANQETTGTHVNGTAIGMFKDSDKTQLATQLVSLLLDTDQQLNFVKAKMDYPAVEGLFPNDLVESWGMFRASDKNWSRVGTLIDDAKALISGVGYQ